MSVTYINNTDAIKRQIAEKEEEILYSWGETLKTACRLLAPKDMGDLQRSIDYKVDEADKSVSYGSNMVDEDYPIYQELGTSKMDANPYIQPALDNNKNQLVQFAKDKLKEIGR